MLRTIRRGTRRFDGGVICATLTLLLVARMLIGPSALAAPVPGLIPICAGNQIIYVSLDGTPDHRGKAPSQPCPVFGFAPALLHVTDLAAEPIETAAACLSPPSRTHRPHIAERTTNQPRAPPGVT